MVVYKSPQSSLNKLLMQIAWMKAYVMVIYSASIVYNVNVVCRVCSFSTSSTTYPNLKPDPGA